MHKSTNDSTKIFEYIECFVRFLLKVGLLTKIWSIYNYYNSLWLLLVWSLWMWWHSWLRWRCNRRMLPCSCLKSRLNISCSRRHSFNIWRCACITKKLMNLLRNLYDYGYFTVKHIKNLDDYLLTLRWIRWLLYGCFVWRR